ncbi:MAG: NADH-quinone oxidoreductase subunit M, partial [Actinobacteria bacterium]
MLTALIAVPLVGVVVVLLAGRFGSRSMVRAGALGIASAELAVAAVAAYAAYAGGGLTESFAAEADATFWHLALDGLSSPLVLLTALLGVVAVLASWEEERSPAGHHALLLALTSAVMGVFLAADLITFYVAWEAVLIPMFFLIGVWGHERRRHAAMKFFVFTFAGSVLMLVGLLIAMRETDQTTFAGILKAGLDPGPARTVFWLLAAGFLVKVPVVGLHTWLPDAHVEAPTAGSIMLAGVLLKMGSYGLMRLSLPLAPAAFESARGLLAALGICGIVYGALMALAQSDLKRLVAYSSVSHMGFVVLAIAAATPLAFGGAMLGMVSHGLVAGLLFLLVGAQYERTHTRDLAKLGGLGTTLPRWSAVFVFAALASAGLPGLSGFPGEFVAVTEAFAPFGWWAALAASGAALAAAYNLNAVRRAVTGSG